MTFHKEEDAGSAMLSELKRRGGVIANILPVSAWRQLTFAEKPINDHASNETTFLDLTDKCLLKIIDYCGSREKAKLWLLCKRTRSLLDDELVWPKVLRREYTIVWDFQPDRASRRLEIVREDLKWIGPHVEKLRMDTVNDAPLRLRNPPEFNQMLRICCKYLAASINELDIVRLTNANHCLKLIQPILNKIEILTFRNIIPLLGAIDVHLPNLKQLMLLDFSADMLCDDFIQKNSSKLEKLSIRHLLAYRPDYQVDNEILKCLEIPSCIYS